MIGEFCVPYFTVRPAKFKVPVSANKSCFIQKKRLELNGLTYQVKKLYSITQDLTLAKKGLAANQIHEYMLIVLVLAFRL